MIQQNNSIVRNFVTFTVNPGHARTIFLKFERSFEIYMSVLKIANEISEFPYKFPQLIDSIKL